MRLMSRPLVRLTLPPAFSSLIACCTAPVIALPLMLRSALALRLAPPVMVALPISCRPLPELMLRLPACTIGLPKAAKLVGVWLGNSTERSIDTVWNTGWSL